ncbi:MAG TPA: M23 family metallopeptidase [Candidatus Limnocylindrales bacterium]|nr:M23 family metallopeptidase [Candidatus Limnocylindrales bacterium]
MPHRRHARPLRAQPPASSFLPPQPVYDRGRRIRLGQRAIVAIAIGVGLALIVPLALAVLGPASGPLQPLGGGVAGAVSASREPTPTATATPLAASGPPSGLPGGSGEPGGSGDVVPPPVVELSAPPIATLTGYRWPISQGRISLPFKDIPGGTRIRNGKLMHDGVDMASFCGARVGAAHDGVVLAAGRHFDAQIGWIGSLAPYLHLLDAKHMWIDLPNVVVIDDGNGYRSIYAHFRDVTVKVGQHVKAGQQIGHEGATGHASGCHVHYGLFSPLEAKTFGVRADILMRLKLPKYEIARIDPLQVLPGGAVALKTRQIATAIAAAKTAAAKAAAAKAAAAKAAAASPS